MRNHKLADDYFPSSYTLKEGSPYRHIDNRDRVVAASLVVNKTFTIKETAYRYGCCENTIRNWIKTLDNNNPHMDG
jgi:hypothetical protein